MRANQAMPLHMHVVDALTMKAMLTQNPLVNCFENALSKLLEPALPSLWTYLLFRLAYLRLATGQLHLQANLLAPPYPMASALSLWYLVHLA